MENIEISEAAGIDKLTVRFLKDGAEILSKPLCEMCNFSISHRIFPNGCKVAKLNPIFEKGKKVEPSNYTRISLLPLISKMIEKVVHDQTNEFLSDNQIFIRLRTNHSTNLCLSFLTESNRFFGPMHTIILVMSL